MSSLCTYALCISSTECQGLLWMSTSPHSLPSELLSKHVLALQGTDQQRYAAAALQKLDWYYTPQTRRWYKAVKSPVIDSARKVCLI